MMVFLSHVLKVIRSSSEGYKDDCVVKVLSLFTGEPLFQYFNIVAPVCQTQTGSPPVIPVDTHSLSRGLLTLCLSPTYSTENLLTSRNYRYPHPLK